MAAKRPAKVPAAPTVRIETVPLSAIDLGVGIQPRGETSGEVVADYADAIREGATFPPVILFRDGEVLRLVDGWHRHNAARSAGLTEIVAEVHDGDLEAATLYAVGANALHGERRTNADKRHAVTMALKFWPGEADREIARKCGVSQPFVGSVRGALSDNGYQIADPETRTVTRGGTTYQQKVARKKTVARAEPASDPVVSLPLPSPPLMPAPAPAPAVEPLPEQEPGSNVIPLGDRLKPVVTERQAEREAEAEGAKEDALSGEDYDDHNPVHRARVVAHAITHIWMLKVTPEQFWALFEGIGTRGWHIARVRKAREVIAEIAKHVEHEEAVQEPTFEGYDLGGPK